MKAEMACAMEYLGGQRTVTVNTPGRECLVAHPSAVAQRLKLLTTVDAGPEEHT